MAKRRGKDRRTFDRYAFPERRLKWLRENGRRQGKVTALIVHRISPEIRQKFGEKFYLLEEGGGLYGHKFDYAFATCTPSPRMSFWWREVAARCDGGAVSFM